MPDGYSPSLTSRTLGLKQSTLQAVVLFTKEATPPLDPDFLALLRTRLPEINAAFAHDPSLAQKLHDDFIRQINNYDTAIILAGSQDDFDLNWQLGRLKDNIGQPEESLEYLKQALNLDPENKHVIGRIVSASLNAYAQTRNTRFLKDAKGYLDALTAWETSEFTTALQERIANTDTLILAHS